MVSQIRPLRGLTRFNVRVGGHAFQALNERASSHLTAALFLLVGVAAGYARVRQDTRLTSSRTGAAEDRRWRKTDTTGAKRRN